MFTLLDLQTQLVHPLQDLLILASFERQMEIANFLDQIPRFDDARNDLLAQLEHRNDAADAECYLRLHRLEGREETRTDQQQSQQQFLPAYRDGK